MYTEHVPESCKSYGAQWIAHKLQVMQFALNNFNIDMQHLESLSKADSQTLKRAKIEGEETV